MPSTATLSKRGIFPRCHHAVQKSQKFCAAQSKCAGQPRRDIRLGFCPWHSRKPERRKESWLYSAAQVMLWQSRGWCHPDMHKEAALRSHIVLPTLSGLISSLSRRERLTRQSSVLGKSFASSLSTALVKLCRSVSPFSLSTAQILS